MNECSEKNVISPLPKFSKINTKTNMSSSETVVIPRRYGLKYDPPTITMEYMRKGTDTKLRYCSVLLDETSRDAESWTEAARSEKLFDFSNTEQLRGLIDRLLKHVNERDQNGIHKKIWRRL